MVAQTIKVLAVVGLLGAAAWWTLGRSHDEPIPESTSKSYWKCTLCGEVQELTDQEYDRQKHLTVTAQHAAGEEKKVGGRGASLALALICPKCQKVSAQLSTKCGKCGEVYVYRKPDGSRNACPKCNPDKGT